MLEIERKWRLEKLPDCCVNSLRIEIDQGYIFDGPSSLRLRKSCTKSHKDYTMTVKGSGDLARAEWETEIPKWVFDTLWKRVDRFLFKDRFMIPTPDHIFEFDEYKLKLAGLLILECEFTSIEDANSFVLPDWIVGAVDVTRDPRYKNCNLTKLGSLEHLKLV